MKLVVNRCYGGFSVTKAVCELLGLDTGPYRGYLINEDFGIESDNYDEYRAHPSLVSAVEELGVEQASGVFACLEVLEIPDDIEWVLHEYEGIETVHEKHRSW